jgi:hypothetical protein
VSSGVMKLTASLTEASFSPPAWRDSSGFPRLTAIGSSLKMLRHQWCYLISVRLVQVVVAPSNNMKPSVRQ